jgi:hypothetical protein
MKKPPKPTHKECRQCHQWFELPRYSRPTRRFCSLSCAATFRMNQLKNRKAQSEIAKAHADPEVMRERARALWRDPEVRARLVEERTARSNTKEHLAWMAEHNKRLWQDKEFRKRHTERTSKRSAEKWLDPEYRAKMSAATAEANRKRWADPEYRDRVSWKIRIAKAQTHVKRRQKEVALELAQRPEEQDRKSQRMKDRWADPEQRARMSALASETAKRKWQEPEYRENKIAMLRSTVEKSRARMIEMNKKNLADPEYLARRKAWWTPERRAAQIEANKKRWDDPEYKARVGKKISEAKKGASMKPVELLTHASLFLMTASQIDIDFEREQLEAMHDCKLEPYRVTHETRSGAMVTRVEWRVL